MLVGHQVFAAAYDTGIFAIDERNGEIRWTLREKAITQLATDNSVLIAAGPGKVAIDLQITPSLVAYQLQKRRSRTIRIQGGRIHFPVDLDRVQILSLKTGQPLQAVGSGLGVTADIDLNQDLLFTSQFRPSYATSNALNAGRIPTPNRESQQLPFFNQ